MGVRGEIELVPSSGSGRSNRPGPLSVDQKGAKKPTKTDLDESLEGRGEGEVRDDRGSMVWNGAPDLGAHLPGPPLSPKSPLHPDDFRGFEDGVDQCNPIMNAEILVPAGARVARLSDGGIGTMLSHHGDSDDDTAIDSDGGSDRPLRVSAASIGTELEPVDISGDRIPHSPLRASSSEIRFEEVLDAPREDSQIVLNDWGFDGSHDPRSVLATESASGDRPLSASSKRSRRVSNTSTTSVSSGERLKLPPSGRTTSPRLPVMGSSPRPIAQDDGVSRPFHRNRLFRPVVCIALYFATGLVFYTQHEGWSVVDALYFCVVVVTTVGYGDNDPIKTDVARLFTSMFALLGVAFVFGSLSIVIDVIHERTKKMASKAAKSAVANSFNADSANEKVPENAVGIHIPPKSEDSSEEKQWRFPALKPVWKWYKKQRLLRSFLWMVAVMSIGIAFVCTHKRVEVNDDPGEPAVDNYSFIEGLYWVCITGTTVGFGDFSPETRDARIFAIFYIVILVMATGGFLGAIGQLLDGARQAEREALLNRGLSTALIRELDEDNDGEVTRTEWLKGMLVALEEVDGELVDIILAQFDKLDADGSGALDMDDIRAAIEDRPDDDELSSIAGALSPDRTFQRELNAYKEEHGDPHQQGVNVGIFRF